MDRENEGSEVDIYYISEVNQVHGKGNVDQTF